MDCGYDYPCKGLISTLESVVSMEIIYNKYTQILTIKYDKDETVYTNGGYDGYDINTDLSLSQRYGEHSAPPLTTATLA